LLIVTVEVDTAIEAGLPGTSQDVPSHSAKTVSVASA
jgi:hypothetical protein